MMVFVKHQTLEKTYVKAQANAAPPGEKETSSPLVLRAEVGAAPKEREQ